MAANPHPRERGHGMRPRDERIYDAVAEGVERAFWRLFTNATDMPCHDFYATIQRAVEAATDRATDRNDGTSE